MSQRVQSGSEGDRGSTSFVKESKGKVRSKGDKGSSLGLRGQRLQSGS